MSLRIRSAVVCLMLAAVVCTGCSGTDKTDDTTCVTTVTVVEKTDKILTGGADETSAETETEQTTVSEQTSETSKDSGKTGGIDYKIVNIEYVTNAKEKGYFTLKMTVPKAYVLIVITAGEKPTGGYAINISDVYEDEEGNFVVKTEETYPDAGSTVFEALTYPTCALSVSRLPEKLKVIDQEGNELKKISNMTVDKIGNKITDTAYMAVLEDGAGERMKKTYVYKTESGYKYTNVVETTEHWGSAKWNVDVKDSGEASSKEEIISIAKEFGSCGFVLFPGDSKPVPVEEFLKRE